MALPVTIAKRNAYQHVFSSTKKGACKVAVKVEAAGHGNYKASGYKKVTFKVRAK